MLPGVLAMLTLDQVEGGVCLGVGNIPNQAHYACSQAQHYFNIALLDLSENGVKCKCEWIELPTTNYSTDRSTASYLQLEYIKEKQLGEDPRSHVHLALYFVSPHARELSSLDLECLKFLCAMTQVIVVIGRADACLLPSELTRLKQRIHTQLEQEEIKLFRQEIFTPTPLSKLLFTRFLADLIDT